MIIENVMNFLDEEMGRFDKNILGFYEWSVNQMINETCHISFDVINEARRIFCDIETDICSKKNIAFYKHVGEHNEFEYNKDIEIFGEMCSISLNVYVYGKKTDSMFSEKKNMSVAVIPDENKFVFSGGIVIQNGRMTRKQRGIMVHEITHMWFIHNMVDGDKMPGKYYDGWNKLYSLMLPFKKLINNGWYDNDYPDGFEEFIDCIYCSDKQEESAFTNQAWFDVDLEDCNIRKDVDKLIRNTDLYRYSKVLNTFCDRFATNSKVIEYLKVMGLNLSRMDIKSLLDIFKRRNEEYMKRVSMLIYMKKSILAEEKMLIECDFEFEDMYYLDEIWE